VTALSPEPDTREPTQRPVRRPAILVVDDDPSFRDALVAFLEDSGISVVGSARDGAEAVDLAATSHPDVILMDLRMPVMGGLEATKRIKEAHPLTQVLFLSAYDDPGLDRSAMDAGAYCYLVKGCAPRLVLEMIMQAWGASA
jgi:DNA-binding NarL/FixJ family response regulator